MAATDAKPFPQKNVAYRVTFPILDADGDPVPAATGLDSEVSKDGGTFTDCGSEATEIAAASGIYYLDLTAAEMNADTVAIQVKTTFSGAKTTIIIMYPEEQGDIRVNVTAWAGTAVTTLMNAIKTALAKGTDITGFNDLSAAQVNAEVDSALDTAIPGTPTANSVNERIKTMDDADMPASLALLLTRVTSTIFTGITSLKEWLGLIAGKQVGNSTARTELRSTGAGSGTFDEATDSVEAIRDRGDIGWITGGAGDPWSQALPGAYAAGQAGYILGNRLDATISSRATPAQVQSELATYGALKPTVPARTLDVNLNGEAGIDLDNTSGTLAKGTDITGFNDINGANVQSELVTYGALKPTVAARTLDVSAGGEAGLDWANIGTPGATQNLSATIIATVTNLTNDPPGVTTLLSRITATLFTGITSLKEWLGLLAGKQAGNATAKTELRSSGAGSGTYDETTDSQEAIRDRGDAGWITGSAPVDPWLTALPGAYGAGTAGKIVGDNVNATISSRATQTSVDTIGTNITTLLGRITSTLFTGITSLAQWLGMLAGKQLGNSTARTELRATGAGSGTFDEATDSVEALRDRGDASWVTGAAAPTVVQIRQEMDTNSSQLAGIQTKLGTPSNLASGANIAANLVDIENQTDDIGANGSGLTNLGDPRIANLDATVSSRASQASVNTIDGRLDTEIPAIKAVTDKLDTTLELDGAVYRFTVNALENAPVGGGGGTDWTSGEKEQIRHRLGLDGTATAPAATPSLSIKATQDAMNAKLGTPQNLGGGASIAQNLSDIEAQTDDIGVAGAGLTNIGDARMANLDAPVSGRATPAQVLTQVNAALNTAIPASPTTDSINERVKTMDDANIPGKIGTPTSLGAGGASLAGNLQDIEAQTDDIGVNGAGLTNLGDPRLANMDATISSRATPAQVLAQVNAALDAPIPASPTANSVNERVKTMDDANMPAAIAAVDAKVVTVQNKTNALPPDPADASDIAASFATINGKLDTANGNDVAIKAVTDKLDTTLELDGSVYRFTVNALEQAPVGGGGAGDPWNTLLPGAYPNGSAGQILGENLDAKVSSRASQASVDTILLRVGANLFAGITSLGEWLGLMAGKQAADATALSEIQATGAGAGTYSAATDSLEAIRDRGDLAWVGGGSGGNGGAPAGDPCAQNPARTVGPTTEPPLAVEPLARKGKSLCH